MINQPDASARSTVDTRLHGRPLQLARIIWVVVVIGVLALYFGSLPAFHTLLQPPCKSFATCNLVGAITLAQFHTIQAAGVSPYTMAKYWFGLDIAIVLIWSAIGFIIFWRRSDAWVALLVALALILFNVGQQGSPLSALVIVSPAWAVPVEILTFLGQASFGVLLFLFPNGQFAPRWVRWFVLVYLIQTALSLFLPTDLPLSEAYAQALVGLLFLSSVAVALYSQIYRYRHVSTPVERQQVKWAVFGIALTIVLLILLDMTNVFQLSQSSSAYILVENLYPLALLPIPLSIGFAVSRTRLWEVDTLINKTLVYGLLTVLLAAVYAGLIIGLEALVGRFGSSSSAPIVIVVSTLIIAALFQPVRSRIQQIIDHRFYRSKYDAQKTLAAFSATLSNDVELPKLRNHLLEVVNETMQPEHASLWLRIPKAGPRAQVHYPEPPGLSQTG
jgi:hypothetical protein